MRTSIRCLAAHLHPSGLVATNPARLLRRARCAPPPPKALHPDEQRRLLAVLRAAKGAEAERDRKLVELLLNAGVRLGSAVALDVEDIDFAHGEIMLRTTKNDRPAVVLLPRDLACKLRTFVAGRAQGPVFLAGNRRISMRHAQRRIARWMAAAKIAGRSAHSLRHSFAERIYSKTGDLLATQLALGHASVASTCVYARADRARLREVVGA
jgi:site-specific recombinase XerC